MVNLVSSSLICRSRGTVVMSINHLVRPSPDVFRCSRVKSYFCVYVYTFGIGLHNKKKYD